MKIEKFNELYSQLLGSFPKTFEREGMSESWLKVFKDRDAEYFEKTVDYFIKLDRDDMPSVGSALAVHKRIAETGQGKRYHDSKGHEFPLMTDEEAESEYQKMKGFIEAYPYPDYSEKASPEQCEVIDNQYYRLMGRHGINPQEDTHPKVNMLLMADLNKIMG